DVVEEEPTEVGVEALTTHAGIDLVVVLVPDLQLNVREPFQQRKVGRRVTERLVGELPDRRRAQEPLGGMKRVIALEQIQLGKDGLLELALILRAKSHRQTSRFRERIAQRGNVEEQVLRATNRVITLEHILVIRVDRQAAWPAIPTRQSDAPAIG